MKFYDIEQVLILRTLNVSWRKIFTLLYDIQLWQLHTNLQHIHVADRFTYLTRDNTKLNIYMQFVMLVCNLLLKSNTCNKLRIDTC